MTLYDTSRFNLTGGGADLTYWLSNPTTDYDVIAERANPGLPVVGRWRPSRCRTYQAGTSAANPPVWADGAVFFQLRIELFTAEGTFSAAVSHLDYVASLGVTAIVLLPVAEARVPGQHPITPRTIFYGVLRPDVVDATLGGGAGLKAFVAACHARGIAVLVDNVPNGIRRDSPCVLCSVLIPHGPRTPSLPLLAHPPSTHMQHRDYASNMHSLRMHVLLVFGDARYLPISPKFCNGSDVTRRNTTGQHVMAWGSNVELDWTNDALLDW